MLANTENPSLLFLFCGKSKALVALSLNMGITVSSSYKELIWHLKLDYF